MCRSTIPAREHKMDEDRGQDKFKSTRFGNSLMSANGNQHESRTVWHKVYLNIDQSFHHFVLGFLFDPWHSTPVKMVGLSSKASIQEFKVIFADCTRIQFFRGEMLQGKQSTVT